MDAYSGDVETKMKRLFGWLSEKDRRRYAAVEAAKLGHGGVEYIARILSCDPKTIREALKELEEPDDPEAGRVRKKGVDAAPLRTLARAWKPTCGNCWRNSRQAIRHDSASCGRTCRSASYRGGCWPWAHLPVGGRFADCSSN